MVYRYYSAGNESNFRTAAYEAITSFVANATADVKGVVENVIVTTLNRMDHLLGVQVCTLMFDLIVVSSSLRITEPNSGYGRSE